jgi:putative two-component system response regulator
VVISDVQMKGMSGLELCREIKKDFDADVIIITGLVNNFAYEEIIARVPAISSKSPSGWPKSWPA